MSGYPYGYPYQGQPPPPQQQYPSYQPYGAFPPPAPGFGTNLPQSQQQQYAPPTSGYYANAQSAYDYNASSIPGLGTPSSGPVPLNGPYNGAWNQGGFGTGAAQVPYHSYAPPSSTPATYSHTQAQTPVQRIPPTVTPIHASPPKTQTETTPKLRPKAQPAEQPKPQNSDVEAQEEGEIDDGYFDDLYDDASKAPSVTDETAAIAAKPSEGLAVDTPDHDPNFYDTDMEDVSTSQKPSGAADKSNGSVKLHGQPDSDRSRSYSPHLSPVEIRGDKAFFKEPIIHAGAGNREQLAAPAVAAGPSSDGPQGSRSQVKHNANAEASVAAATGRISAIKPSASLTSVFEASNEAKKAILRLLPHGIKYQTYIDEGFEAGLIKDLFTQLNLPTDSAPIEKTNASQDKGTQPPSTQPSQQNETDTMAKKQEERKDKIARLMAEKKAKNAAASDVGATASPKSGEKTASAVSTPPAKPPVTRADKDRLLQQKVEALRNKSREAKKLAQKPVVAQAPNHEATQEPALAQPSIATTQSPGAPQSTPLALSGDKQAAAPTVSALQSASRAPQVNQRKRPVAADFMNDSALPAKRPSLATTQNSSLVISISDDEDDDDVEMDVESATEDSPASIPQNLTLARRGGPSIRDFPPLSNIKGARQVHSPVSGLSASGAKSANADLETKERAILEMQKKIKELEAKKEAKARSGNVTPRSPSASGVLLPEPALQTPVGHVMSPDTDEKTTPSAQLLQEAAEAANPPIPKLAPLNLQIEDGRRIRVPSTLLSVKSAKALEKAERLKRMQEEMLRLQAEIEQEEDELEERPASEDVGDPAKTTGTQGPPGKLVSTEDESDHGAHANITESSPAISGKGQSESDQTSPDAQAMERDPSPGLSNFGNTTTALSHAAGSKDQPRNHTTPQLDAGKLPDASDSPNPLEPQEELAVADLGESDGYEPPEPESKIDGQVGGQSPQPTPAPAEVTHTRTQQRGEAADTDGEAVNHTAPSRQAFAPYESPLRYYHAYRFHPNYGSGIQGGLNSLTYSNRIDPNKEMCPDEWEGNDCPRGDACQFQHFQSIIAPDSDIILELGNSDEFTGDQKRQFNNGLREVVASFQKSKAKDFATIAQAIVDFRHKFLGDSSKVLRLEGVNI